MNARLLVVLLLVVPGSALAKGKKPAASAPAASKPVAAAPVVKALEGRHVKVGVTEAGFEPAEIAAHSGEQLVLDITRVTDETCATAIVIPAQKVKVELPLNKEVQVPVSAGTAGRVAFACPMNMITGAIVVKE
jgi:plastocyanin domain-containing protein